MAKNFVELNLCARVLCKVEYMSDKIGYLTLKISKVSVKRMAWSFLTALVTCEKSGMY